MILTRALLCLALFAALACSSNSSNSPLPPVNGTSDSGGGNGVDNKAYEAYIVKPEQLPAYQSLIAPKIKQLTALIPQADIAEMVLRRWLLYKTWYIAPVKLDTISKDVIGISFSTDKTEQLALQLKKSIWINSDSFQRMTMQDQATLIVHEMVMSLYYLRFKSWEDICREQIYPQVQCLPTDYEVLNGLFPGSEPKPFDANDYENIRTVTGLFLGELPFNTSKEVDDFLIQNGFDRRFTFKLGLDGATTNPSVIYRNSESISIEEFHRILNTAEILHVMPDQCQGVKFKQPFDCNFKFEKSSLRTKEGYVFPQLLFTTSAPANSLVFAQNRMLFGNVDGISVEFVQQKKKVFYYLLKPDPTPTPLIVGTIFRSGFLVSLMDLEQSQPTQTLLGLITIPGVVTGITADGTECLWAKPSAISLQTDTIMVRSKHLSDFEKALLSTRSFILPTYTSCRIF